MMMMMMHLYKDENSIQQVKIPQVFARSLIQGYGRPSLRSLMHVVLKADSEQ